MIDFYTTTIAFMLIELKKFIKKKFPKSLRFKLEVQSVRFGSTFGQFAYLVKITLLKYIHNFNTTIFISSPSDVLLRTLMPKCDFIKVAKQLY